MNKLTIWEHFRPNDVSIGSYSNVLIMHGTTKSNFYAMSKGDMFMITFPKTITISVNRNGWEGNVQFRAGNQSGGGYEVRLSDYEYGEGQYKITFLKGEVYKFIGNSETDKTKKNTIVTKRGFIVDRDSTEINFLDYIGPSGVSPADSPSQVSLIRSQNKKNIIMFNKYLYDLNSNSDGFYSINANNWITTYMEDRRLLDLYSGNHTKQRAIAVVTNKNGNGNTYTQRVFGKENCLVRYAKDTRFNDFSNSYLMLESIQFDEYAEIEVIGKLGEYHEEPLYPRKVYWITIKKSINDKYLSVSVVSYSYNSSSQRIVSGVGEVNDRVVKTGEHTKLFQYSDPRGSWIQVWLENIDNSHFNLKMGAGSGLTDATTAMVTSVKTDDLSPSSFVNRSINWYSGTFSTPAKQAEFMAITTSVSSRKFENENTLTGIDLPKTTLIGDTAFAYSKPTYINVPKATTIGRQAFFKVVNKESTLVIMNKKFNTNAEKDRIFGGSNWTNITFRWLNDDGSIHAEPIVIYNANNVHPASDGSGFTIPTDELNGSSFFNGNLWIRSRSDSTWGKGALYGAEKRITVYTQAELNAFLKNPSSVSGGAVTDDYRIPGGDYGANLNCRLHIEFIDMTIGGNVVRMVTKLSLVAQDYQYTDWANQQVDYYKFVLTDIDGKALPTSPTYPKEPNSFAGTFSTPAKQAEFMAVSDTVLNEHFTNAKLTSISLPEVITIGNHAFMNSPLTTINVPKATTIGFIAFSSAVNDPTTSVTMNKKFNTDAEKSRIFGKYGWDRITFHWTNDDGSIHAEPIVIYNADNVHPASDGSGFTIPSSVPNKPSFFNGNLWIKSKSDSLWGKNALYGSEKRTTVYTQAELNAFLKNPSSVSGGAVTDDYRIPGGSYGDQLNCRLHIEFSEVSGGRKVTRLYIAPVDGNTYQVWTNQQVDYYKFVLTDIEGEALPTSPTYP